MREHDKKNLKYESIQWENFSRNVYSSSVGNLHNTHYHHIPPRPPQMVGKPAGNPCRPLFFFEVVLHAAATRGYKWQACGSVGNINIIASCIHLKKKRESEVTVVQKQTVITFKPEYQHT